MDAAFPQAVNLEIQIMFTRLQGNNYGHVRLLLFEHELFRQADVKPGLQAS